MAAEPLTRAGAKAQLFKLERYLGTCDASRKMEKPGDESADFTNPSQRHDEKTLYPDVEGMLKGFRLKKP